MEKCRACGSGESENVSSCSGERQSSTLSADVSGDGDGDGFSSETPSFRRGDDELEVVMGTGTTSEGSSPLGWPLGRSDTSNSGSSTTPLPLTGGRDTVIWEDRTDKLYNDVSEIELMKERFAKLLLGEDMSGGGKGVCTALAISNAITNLSASVFGELWRLEPLASQKKSMWRREMEWLLCVSDSIVELIPTCQELPEGASSNMATSIDSANNIISYDLTETFLWLGNSSWNSVFLICVLGVISIYVYVRLPTWKLPNIPSPPESWLFGHLPLIAKGGPDVFISLARKYGPIYRFNFGRQPLVIVADADLCREAGIKKFKFLSNRSIPSPIASSPLHQKGLFFTRNSRWSSMRGAIQPLYQPSRIASQVPLMERTICILKDHLCTKDEKEDINFSELLLKVATDIIGEAAFGERFDLTQSTSQSTTTHPIQEEVSEFVKQHVYSTTSLKMDLTGTFSIIMGILFPVLQEPFRQILSRVPGTGDWKVEQNNRKLTDRLNAIVAKRSMDLGLESRTDFLSSVLNARESSKDARDLFSPDYISALTYEHLLAGSATTSFTLSTVLYLVSAHPHVEKKLLQEIDAFGPPDRNPTAEDLDKFPYLTQVIKEVMRYYTVSPLVAREVNEDVDIGGYLFPKGTWVWLALNAPAKDPTHFPEPEKFKPERFDLECEEEKKRHPYANIPFGIGPRACIGMRFSYQEIKLAMIHLYQFFTFEHSPLMEKPLAFQYGIVLSPKYGVKLRVHQRRAHNTNIQ